MFGSVKKIAKKIGGQVKRSAVQLGKKAEKYGGAAIGQNFSRDKSSGDANTPAQGPQFTDEARRQAAGAGTVGFTQRTQNY
jgi:hypothetical protein